MHSQKLCSNVQIHASQLVNSRHKEGSKERQMSLDCTKSNGSRGNEILCLVWFGNELCDVVAGKSHNEKKRKTIGSVQYNPDVILS